jgi:hypothetical protein
VFAPIPVPGRSQEATEGGEGDFYFSMSLIYFYWGLGPNVACFGEKVSFSTLSLLLSFFLLFLLLLRLPPLHAYLRRHGE